MTAATATPLAVRDRLLQAIDGQSNICNMVVVMEVISFLEKYPITKEALEETRLGKLINDVRKKTKNEDLARRAKKLLRNWQKLIEPGKVEVLSKGWYSGVPASATAMPLAKVGLELKNRNDFNNCSSFTLEKTSHRKREHPQFEGQAPAKLPKINNSKNLPPTGNGGHFMECHAHQPHEREFPRPLDIARLSTTPVSAIKPHPSALGYNKPPGSLLKASVVQQQSASASWGQCQQGPRGSLQSPQNSKQGADVKQTVTQAQRLHSITVTSGSHTSELRPFNVFGPADCLSKDTDIKDNCPKTPLYNLYGSSYSDSISMDESGPEKRKAQKCKSEDTSAGLDGQTVEDGVKEIRLFERRLTFNPLTGQIKPCLHKEPSQEGAVSLGHTAQLCPEQSKQSPPPLLSLLQQKELKNLSRSKIIQSYFSQQSSLLMSSGAEVFTTESKSDQSSGSSSSKMMHTLAAELPARDLPGISREIATEDVKRLHMQRWPGVNGCYDTKGNWFDWTESIPLDLHGDETRLNILPYVSLD
ncbi:mediator of RNA polymerase II transcription subunit 26 [Takifugu rubripes]|uniref:Mediator of RNA polymerase II transcription subunit 26 n=1 Tax=Takifugu rubripes TaxID=31033 RepID=H2SX44_TAKRU|nr:mediator of RNA polymerase II transcription subunit 26 [Takifugu rubripes]